MKVSRLVEILQSFGSPDSEIVIDGHDGDQLDIDQAERVTRYDAEDDSWETFVLLRSFSL